MICTFKLQFNLIMKRLHLTIILLVLLLVGTHLESTQTFSIQRSMTKQEAEKEELENHGDTEQQQHHAHLSPSSPQFWINVLLIIVLTCTGGFCSGLAIGIFSISTLQLQMMMHKNNQTEKKHAQAILKITQNRHLFLVSLLIANAIALQSLPLVAHSLMPDWLAIIFSTIIVLVVAEIVPQAFCTGPHKITIAYYASPVIAVLIKVFWILAYPIAMGLDKLLGVHAHERIAHKDFVTFLNDDKFLKDTQKLLLTSTLQLRNERVTDIMINSSNLYMLEEDVEITHEIAKEIYEQDYSFVLVYRKTKNKITGIIKVKNFATNYLRCKNKNFLVKEVMTPNPEFLIVYKDTNLLLMMMLFQAKSTRVALVCNQNKEKSIQSIEQSKSAMIMKITDKEPQIIGAVFLYQMFDELTKLKEQITRQSNFNREGEQEIEMKERLSDHLLRK